MNPPLATRPASGRTVLIVDDVPQNLAVLHDTLDESGYRVLVATRGEAALERAQASQPDIILLDAVMPGMDGFAVCRALRDNPLTREIPVIFMTGLTESEDVVRGFDAGGNDYITKPVRPSEVLARIAAHLKRARHLVDARAALDLLGRATLALDPDSGALLWQTPAARTLLEQDLPAGNSLDERLAGLRDWLAEWRQAAARGSVAVSAAAAVGDPAVSFVLPLPDGQLHFTLRGVAGGGEWLIAVRREAPAARASLLAGRFALTPREAEVLEWMVLGKTNRDIADILVMSPRTVDKHVQHVLEKLGVETRTAAAALALAAVRDSPHAD